MIKEEFQNENMRRLIENLWDAMYIVNEDKEIVHWSKMAEDVTGYMAEEVVGRKCGEELLSHHCESTILCSVGCPLKQTLKDGEVREAQVSLTNKNGISVPVFVRTLPYYDAAGAIVGAVEVFRKLNGADEVAGLLHELNNLAYVEPLTKAARRNYGEEVLDKALAAFSGTASPFGVLLLDLDRFKSINDTYGHQAGDHALANISELIRRNLRSSDLLVRWGGDEFLVIATGLDTAVLANLGEKLRGLAEGMCFEYNGSDIPIRLSIGGAFAKLGDTREGLLERADKNLYSSKEKGRNICTIEAFPGT